MKIQSNEITMVDTKTIKPHPKNNNIHPTSQIKRLEKLVSYQGFRVPLIVSNLSGFLVSGHARLIMAKKKGIKKLPVIYQDFEDELQEWAFMTSDNAIQDYSEIDMNAIDLALEELEEGFDVELLGIEDLALPTEEDLPDLNGNEPECIKVSFVLSLEQRDLMEKALGKAKRKGHISDPVNTNSNGNALAAILRDYANS